MAELCEWGRGRERGLQRLKGFSSKERLWLPGRIYNEGGALRGRNGEQGSGRGMRTGRNVEVGRLLPELRLGVGGVLQAALRLGAGHAGSAAVQRSGLQGVLSLGGGSAGNANGRIGVCTEC